MGSLNTEGSSSAWNPSSSPRAFDAETASQWLDAMRQAEPPPPPPGAATAAAPAAPAASDTATRQALAAKMVVGNQTATPADIKLVTDHLAATMPLKEMQALDSAGIKVKVTQGSVTSEVPSLGDARPRGYPPGKTWHGRPGTYWPPRKEIILATQSGSDGSRIMPGANTSSSADVLLHESAHAFNRLGVFTNRSDQDAFVAAYRADASNSGKLAAAYYHQPEHPAAGRDEAYAESNAMYLTSPEQLKKENPHLYDYWDAHLGH